MCACVRARACARERKREREREDTERKHALVALLGAVEELVHHPVELLRGRLRAGTRRREVREAREKKGGKEGGREKERERVGESE